MSGYPVDRISHIGSTAIHGIQAKNIVDVMIEISEKADIEEVAHTMEQSDFIRMSTLFQLYFKIICLEFLFRLLYNVTIYNKNLLIYKNC